MSIWWNVVGLYRGLRAWRSNRAMALGVMYRLSQAPEYSGVDSVALVTLAQAWVYCWHAAAEMQIRESGDETAEGYAAADRAAERMADLAVWTIYRGGKNLIALEDTPDVMGSGAASSCPSSAAS